MIRANMVSGGGVSVVELWQFYTFASVSCYDPVDDTVLVSAQRADASGGLNGEYLNVAYAGGYTITALKDCRVEVVINGVKTSHTLTTGGTFTLADTSAVHNFVVF